MASPYINITPKMLQSIKASPAGQMPADVTRAMAAQQAAKASMVSQAVNAARQNMVKMTPSVVSAIKSSRAGSVPPTLAQRQAAVQQARKRMGM